MNLQSLGPPQGGARSTCPRGPHVGSGPDPLTRAPHPRQLLSGALELLSGAGSPAWSPVSSSPARPSLAGLAAQKDRQEQVRSGLPAGSPPGASQPRERARPGGLGVGQAGPPPLPQRLPDLGSSRAPDGGRGAPGLRSTGPSGALGAPGRGVEQGSPGRPLHRLQRPTDGRGPEGGPERMRYVSTRGAPGARGVDFEAALFSGYAADGGLLMPEAVPALDWPTLQRWRAFSYPELVGQLCSLFISAELIPEADLKELIDQAFSRFRHKDVVHLARLKNGLNVLELWHGATYAFKDLSLSCTGQFLQYFLKKRKKHITILVGTSGDTGSSAIESVRGEKNMDIFVLLPRGLCSQVQELQMTTVVEENVHVFLADGNSDEIDEPIKELFADEDFARRHNLMSLNSINWSRILVQMAHYFFAYFQCAPPVDAAPLPVVEIIVPTGGGGNLTAGFIAQKMGLPIELVAVVNSNDIVHRTARHGDFSVSGRRMSTLASAMDIQEPYNMERIFWLLSGSDSNLVKSLMEEFYTTKKVRLPDKLQKKLSEVLKTSSFSDEEVLQTMRDCWEENGYLLCPHSAVAVSYHYRFPGHHSSSFCTRGASRLPSDSEHSVLGTWMDTD
ncbi:threonine synthase-like 2 isoform X3 [Sphaerodactylus townsendi]|uniref:threonine synthase-like 2 isoform X3 n=1 Tax=Sphaerodactylus townsendi TaxID=933632 RepID=UPI00202716EC|nr:threonine synthase-like 2 isoform X3 [Sphaerodactylus townsendi]